MSGRSFGESHYQVKTVPIHTADSPGATVMKRILIVKLGAIGDVVFASPAVNAIKTILDSRIKDTFIELTADQEKELLLASKEGKNGQVVSQSEMDQNVEEWLSGR